MRPEEIFQILTEEGAEYILVGGLAATVHGASLVTLDTDICFRQEAANCERLARALERLGAEVVPARQRPIPITGALLGTHRMVHVRTRAGRLDLLADIPGLGRFEDIVGGSTRIALGELTIPVLTLDQLIQAKSALDQPKDREHLDQLLAIRKLRQPK